MKFSNIEIALEEGRMKIPQFQRNFVWTLEESAALLDSVIKGYPVGSIILWNTAEKLWAVKNIGGLPFDTVKEGTPVNYIIDGQQRVTSLYAILKGVDEIDRNGKKTSYKNVYVDLNIDPKTEGDERIVVLEKEAGTPEDSKRYITLHELFKGSPKITTKYPEYTWDNITLYRDKIVGFILPTIDLPANASIEVATEIFTRLNTRGKPLGIFEIMVARTYDENHKFDLSKKYIELSEKLGDWKISNSTVLQVISALLEKNCSKKKVLLLEKDAFINTWSETVEALKTTIDFFKNHYRIPSSKLLPYDGLIVLFAYYFFKKRDNKDNKVTAPIGKDADYLKDLFWRVSLGERYSSATETKITQDLKKIDIIIAGDRPKYEWKVDTSPESIKNNGEFGAGRSFIKAILVIYAAENPKCFRTGGDVILDNSYLKQANSKNYHHFFPKGFLNKKSTNIVEESFNDGEARKDFYVNHILNITIIGAGLNSNTIRAHAPSKYLSAFQKENPELKLKEHLKTHLIELDEDEVLENNYKKFFNNRAERVSKEIKKRIIED